MTIHSAVIQKLLTTNAHLGRRMAEHHFKIYTYGTRNNTVIIDSDKTLICLRNACDFIANLVRLKGRFIFVNTNPLVDEIIEQMTRKIGVRNDTSWRLGGFLTNSCSPRRFRSRNKKLNLPAIHPPDCVVIMDTERKCSVIEEATRLEIPIVGLVDSSMPWETFKKITYPVPANDSVQFVYLFCNMITKTFLYEQKKLAALKGKHAKEDEVEVMKKDEQEVLLENGGKLQSTKLSKIDGTGDELCVLPYDGLLPTSDDASETRRILDKLVVLKVNAELGINIGFDGPKSSIEVCDGLTCLDLLANHIESVNLNYGCNIPLLLMNAENTHDATLKVLEKHLNKSIHTLVHDLQSLDHQDDDMPLQFEERNNETSDDEVDDMPLRFEKRNKQPSYSSKLNAVLLSLKSSGKLEVLSSQGKEYILILNSDNLADVVDPKILNLMIRDDIEYCIEVTQASSKMEESEKNPNETKKQSEENSKLVKTPNTWLSIKAIDSVAERVSFAENLPISKFVYSALALNVPSSRSLPLEATSDLLLLQSDLYTCSEGILTRNGARTNPANPFIELGPEFGKVANFRRRFKSIPSIIELDSLKVTGDVWFGSGITLKGRVRINAVLDKIVIPDGAVLENKVINSQLDI